VKSIAGVNPKTQVSVVEAIRKIAAAPALPQTTAIKSLSRNARGLWACCVGNERLLYFPHKMTKTVLLISYGPAPSKFENSALHPPTSPATSGISTCTR